MSEDEVKLYYVPSYHTIVSFIQKELVYICQTREKEKINTGRHREKGRIDKQH